MTYEKIITVDEYIKEVLNPLKKLTKDQILTLKNMNCPFIPTEKVAYFGFCKADDGRKLIHPMSKKYYKDFE